MRIKQLSFVVLIVSIVAVNAVAQKALPKKPFEQWGRAEITKILFNSPWGMMDVDQLTGRDQPTGSQYQIEVRLYSALPVRQALVRRMQLNIAYNELTAAQKTSFDAEVDGLLNCQPCSDYYIVTLASGHPDPLQRVTSSDPVPANRGPARVVDVIEILKRVSEDELLKQVWLTNDKGERRNAEKLTFTKRNEVVFLFPRLNDQGQPLITAANKKFYFELDEKLFRKEVRPLRRISFEVAPLLKNQEVVF